MNKTTKIILGVLLTIVSIFVIFKFFIGATLKHFGIASESTTLIIDYIAIYVPIFILIVTLIALAVRALTSKK